MELSGRFEVVANVSEGQDRVALDALAAACGATLLDRHADPDHHRSVFTLGGPLITVETGIRRLAEAVSLHVDLDAHAGVHPRFGALDVVPFVALDPEEETRAIDAARAFAGWLAGTLLVPVFLYGDVDPDARSLPETRRQAFTERRPDYGPASPHPTMGATAVGARKTLVAVNCALDTDDLEVARTIARSVREQEGGLPGVRALGFPLPSRALTQVSMNLVDLERTGLEAACTAVVELARAAGRRVVDVELVGLLPRAELERCAVEFRSWAELDDDLTIEARLARAGLGTEHRR